MQQRFSRMERLVGKEGLRRLAAASVAIFGIGGVGSYATEALVRGGVGRLTLVDFDDICPTNINRQIHALEDTVGRAKVEVMAERCRAINPSMEVAAFKAFYRAENAAELLAPRFDYVLDCIDNITAKLHLLQSCIERRLPVISSMGAANKLDPTKIAVADLSQTQKCRLARILRKELRKRGITSGVRVVYSTEEFRPLADEYPDGITGSDWDELDISQQQRSDRQVMLGSTSYIPPIFGLTMAGEVIRALLAKQA